MKKLVYREDAEKDEQIEFISERVTEALEALAELEDDFPGLQGISHSEIEAIVRNILAKGNEVDFFLLAKVNEEVIGLCGLVGKFSQKVSNAISNQKAFEEIPYLGDFSSQEQTISDQQAKLCYRDVRIDKLRALLGFYLLASQNSGEQSMEDLLKKLAKEAQALTLDLIKANPDYKIEGSHYWQLWQFTSASIKTHIRKEASFQAGVKRLAQLAQEKITEEPLSPQYWQPYQPPISAPAQTLSDAELEAQNIEKNYQQALEKIEDKTIELPTEEALKKLFGFDEDVDVKKTLRPLAQAMKIPQDCYQSDPFWAMIAEYIDAFADLEVVANEETRELDTSHLSNKLLFAEFVFWIDSAHREFERLNKV